MKRKGNVFTLMAAMLCMVWTVMLPVRAQEEQILVYAQVPAEWKDPCVWAWADDGTNAFEAWPGGVMTADENNTDWYYCYVPKTAGGNIIINANEGSIQTSDYKTDSENVWLVITDADTVEVSREQLTEGELPEYVASIRISARVPEDWTMPSLWAWSAPDGTNAFTNWPGQELDSTPDGWYTYEVPAWVNSVIVNGNLGEVQTVDISIESRDVWLLVEDGENVTVSYEKPEVMEEMIKVSVKVPSDWLLPCLWAWSAPDGTNLFANWPGQELTQEGDWYTYEIPAWVNSIIVNGNLGSVQTGDISIESMDIWVEVEDADTYYLYYEEPAKEEAAGTSEPNLEDMNSVEADNLSNGSEEENADSHDSSTGIIVAVAVGAMIIMVGVVIILYRKKARG